MGSVTLLNSVCFTDSNTGYIAGFGNGSGIILKTTDGGLTWSSSFSGSDYIFKSVCFSNDSTVYAAGGEAILKTIDRGATWSVVNISTNYNVGFNSIMFSDNSTGYVVGWLDAIYCIRPIILKTMDAGTTWAEPSEMHNLFSSLYSVCFIPSTNGIND
ncbi:MAG: hypothetical protein IPH84_13710 [Bacteroidales bacterium]|nr:hypothetical protein [Bacteroidales bacterium]